MDTSASSVEHGHWFGPYSSRFTIHRRRRQGICHPVGIPFRLSQWGSWCNPHLQNSCFDSCGPWQRTIVMDGDMDAKWFPWFLAQVNHGVGEGLSLGHFAPVIGDYMLVSIGPVSFWLTSVSLPKQMVGGLTSLRKCMRIATLNREWGKSRPCNPPSAYHTQESYSVTLL